MSEFFLNVDGTQDIRAEDQATHFIRYVHNCEIKEQLFPFENVCTNVKI